MSYYYKEKEVLKMNYKNDSNLGNKIVFSENLKYYLSKTGELQKDIAKAAKVSEGTISDWLKKRSYPRMDKIQLLALHWGIEMSDLVEKHSVDNKYYLQKEAKNMAEKLAQNPDALIMLQKYQKLSPENQGIVTAMINSLSGGDK
jgi:transcriptional regulator with XRE-family HTH domain